MAAIPMITITITTTMTQVVYKSSGLTTSFVINDTMLDINCIYFKKILGLLKLIKHKVNLLEF